MLEYPEDYRKGHHHEHKYYEPHPERISDKPSEIDIHTEEAGDESRWHEQQRDKSEDLHDLILIEVDDTEHCILKILETLKTEVSVVDK